MDDAQDQGEAMHTPEQRRWNARRGLAALITFLICSLAYLYLGIPEGHAWEHHPFAGPVIWLHTSRLVADYIISIGLLGILSFGICLPVFRLRPMTVVLSIGSIALWLLSSYLTALGASV
jgi:hypothetical protein